MINQAVNSNNIGYIRLMEQPAAVLLCESKGEGKSAVKSAKENRK